MKGLVWILSAGLAAGAVKPSLPEWSAADKTALEKGELIPGLLLLGEDMPAEEAGSPAQVQVPQPTAEELALARRMVEAFDQTRTPGVIRIHGLRAIRAGRFSHVDAHLVLPEYWTIDRAHEAVDAYERRVVNAVRLDAEIEFHSDPCRQALCSICDVFECPIRREPFEARPPMTIEEARLKDEAFWALRGKTRAA